MGDEADYQIQRMIGRRAARRKNKARKTLQGKLKMADLTGVLPLPPVEPRTFENMPEERKKNFEKMSVQSRAVHILSWLEDISLNEAKNMLVTRRNQEAAEETRVQNNRNYHEKLDQINEAETVADLKAVLIEIIQHIWRPE